MDDKSSITYYEDWYPLGYPDNYREASSFSDDIGKLSEAMVKMRMVNLRICTTKCLDIAAEGPPTKRRISGELLNRNLDFFGQYRVVVRDVSIVTQQQL